MTRFVFIASFLSALAGCGGAIGDAVPEPEVDAMPTEPAPPDAGGEPIDIECLPPNLLVVLDRTGSMAQRPDGTLPENTLEGAEQTKWHAAVSAVQNVTSAYADKLRFGLALFPLDPEGAGGTDCSNLDTWLTEYLPPETNDPSCQPAEVLVDPSDDGADAIASALSTDGIGLCSTTPIGAGLAAAHGALAPADSERDQGVLLITDGADNCDGDTGYTTNSMDAASALAADGIAVYVVGFDGSGEGIDVHQLNNLACAGGTAPDPGANCMSVGSQLLAVPTPTPARLFISASDQQSLESSLADIANSVCCDCVK